MTGLAQTSDGYLWLATPSGLARFDGTRFQQFSLMGYVGEQNRGVLAMLLNREGGLTLAMDRGAVLYLNSGTVRACTVKSGLPDLIPQAVAEDGEGATWIAYRGGRVCRIKGGVVTLPTAQDGVPPGIGNCSFAVDTQGRLWFLKGRQFGVVRTGRFETVSRLDPSPAALAAARDGGVWICSGARLFRFKGSGQPEALGVFDPENAGAEPSAVLEDHSGAVWIGTSFGGLFRYEGAAFERIATSHSQILSLAEDRQGNIWAGTGGGGLNRIRPRAVELEAAETGLPFETVQSVCEDKAGGLWATTQNGSLVRRLGGRWTPVLTNAAWPGEATCLAADASGAVWVGTVRHGLFCWREGGFVPWGGAIQSYSVHALLVSRQGDLWIAESNPNLLQRVRAGKLENFELPRDLRRIRAIAEDADGNIWLGSARGVLLRVTEDRPVDVTSQMLSGFPNPSAACTPRRTEAYGLVTPAGAWAGSKRGAWPG